MSSTRASTSTESTSTESTPSEASRKVILLHPDDNVLIAVESIAAGSEICIEGRPYRLRQAVALGHKVARSDLTKGDKVIRYGAAIGSMTRAVAVGEWVHLHNMRSDYLASHTRKGINRSESE
ncbi:MAG: UxaA family hydrolase [Exilibacterium sp.]